MEDLQCLFSKITNPFFLDEINITTSRFELSESQVGKSVIKIKAKEIEKNLGSSLAQLLNTKVGLNINGSYGQSGSVLTTNIRGGQNRQVLVLINGLPVSDSSQIENNFDLNLIGLEQIEFIEILKGASSVLYGSSASTAVINIVTKSDKEEQIRATLTSTAGTNNTANQSRYELHDFQNTASVRGLYKRLSYNSSFSHRFSDGLSSIFSLEPVTNFDEDDYEKTNIYLKLGYAFSKRFSVSTFFNSDRYNTDYDDSFGFTDANYHAKSKQNRVGLSSNLSYKNGSLNLNAALIENQRSYNSSYPAEYRARALNFDLFNKLVFRHQWHTITGLKFGSSEMESYIIPYGDSNLQKDISREIANDISLDYYLNLVYTSTSGFNFNGGVRLSHHSTYNHYLVYSLNPSYSFRVNNQFGNLTASYSTAFITPSLYQLYAPLYGNNLLTPQRDATLEVGLEVRNPDSFELNLILFRRFQNDFIDYMITNPETFEGRYKNLSTETRVQGLEFEFRYVSIKKLNMDINYAFTESKAKQLFRIPKHKINFNASFEMIKKMDLSLDFQFNGQRKSPQTLSSIPITLNAYRLVHIGCRYLFFDDQLTVFANVFNVFDENYQEIYRYTTLGRNFRLGVKFDF